MITFGWYADSSLTVPLVSLSQAFTSDGSDGAVDKLVYLGSTTSNKKLLAGSDPGVDAIQFTVVDSDGALNGQAATDIKLALSQAGLDTATGGEALDGPSQVLSGVAQALPIWIRIDPSEMTEDEYNDLTVRCSAVVERVAA
jgi:hypothetical protein